MAKLVLYGPEIMFSAVQPHGVGMAKHMRVQLAYSGLFADTRDLAVQTAVAEPSATFVYEKRLPGLWANLEISKQYSPSRQPSRIGHSLCKRQRPRP